MPKSWETINTLTVEGRPVKILVHPDAGYKIETVQAEDEIGDLEHPASDVETNNQATTIIYDSLSAGEPIGLPLESREEMEQDLADIGFSADGIAEILAAFPEGVIGSDSPDPMD